MAVSPQVRWDDSGQQRDSSGLGPDQESRKAQWNAGVCSVAPVLANTWEPAISAEDSGNFGNPSKREEEEVFVAQRRTQ